MSLARLPKTAIDLIFTYTSHPTADLIHNAWKLDDDECPHVCCECGMVFGRYDRGLWCKRYILLCGPCIVPHMCFEEEEEDLMLPCVYNGALRRTPGVLGRLVHVHPAP